MAIEPHQAAATSANATAATGRRATWKAISFHRTPDADPLAEPAQPALGPQRRHRVGDAHVHQRIDPGPLERAHRPAPHEQEPGERQGEHERDQQPGRRRQQGDDGGEGDRRDGQGRQDVARSSAPGGAGGATAGGG